MKRLNLLLGTAVFPSLLLLILFLGFQPTKTQGMEQLGRTVTLSAGTTLYDATLGGTPDTQAMFYVTQPIPPSQATQIYSDGVTILDSMATALDYAGYFGDPAFVPTLDRTLGYTLSFTVQVEQESHNNNNRAGFSVILLSEDLLGIELGFWQNEIWAQEDDTPGPIFTHAEGVSFTPTVSLIPYALEVLSDTYTLFAGEQPILTGPLRDYTAFSGTIDPYETPNLIFLGDDTTSARARIRLQTVTVTYISPLHDLYLPIIQQP